MMEILNTNNQFSLDLGREKDFIPSIATKMLELFRGDVRRVMQQLSQGGYGVFHSGPLTSNDLIKHLNGKVSVSLYLLDENCLCATMCFDIDIPKIEIPENPIQIEIKKRTELLPVAIKIIQYIQSAYNVPDESFLLEDTGGRGYHVWLIFRDPQPADSIIMFAREVKRSVGAKCVEIFPASSMHGPSGYSKSNVRLPLGRHQKYPGARSAFLNLRNHEKIPITEILEYLENLAFVSTNVLNQARVINTKQIDSVLLEEVENTIDIEKTTAAPQYLAKVGNMISLCPALSDLEEKALSEGHLMHHERIALALILKHCKDGEKYIHDIMSKCSDYSADETQKHISSIEGYYPISCLRLQSAEYKVCQGWCTPQLRESIDKRQSPTPLWFAQLGKSRRDIRTDGMDLTLIEQIAAIDNLYQAWNQARIQAKERDIFEDILAYQVFEEHLDANLQVIRGELLGGFWRHQPFQVVLVPKRKDDTEDMRPMCWATPWDSIVDLALLNVIGPPIDSTFHDNSLGNRLAHGPKNDGQVFQDWRKQNRYREIRKEGFSEYGECYFYLLTDIKRFYEYVQHDRLMISLQKRVSDQKVLDIVQQYLEAIWINNDSSLTRPGNNGKQMGLPQGPALSAFLANLYIDELDYWLEKKCVDFIRYVDDLAILTECEENAKEVIEDLQKVLKEEFSLELNLDKDKTQGPFPATNMKPITDWIRDARYELIKYSRRADTLTIFEKNEMRAALAIIAGAKLNLESDIIRLVKYLGFYIATTEKLEQPELQRSVYVLSLFILTEYRPKHNATCIAVRALIKACCEFGDSVWYELKKLLESRQDEYIRIILAQETRRFFEEDESQLDIHSGLLKEIESQAQTSDVPAAAAITCLSSIGKTSSIGRDALWNILMGENRYLRVRAISTLSRLKAINSTTLSRIKPEHGDEAALFLISIQAMLSRVIVDSIAEAILIAPMASHSVSALLLACLITGSEKGISAGIKLICLNNLAQKNNICYYVAAKYVDAIIEGKYHANGLENAIRTCVNGGLIALARQLYDLGRFARLLSEKSEIQNILEENEIEKKDRRITANLPALTGFSLGDLIINVSSGIWLHKAMTDDGLLWYHEIVACINLETYLDGKIALKRVLELLNKTDLLILDKIEIRERLGNTYLMTVSPIDKRWQTVGEWIDSTKNYCPSKIAEIVKKAAQILLKSKECLTKNALLHEFLPVPTCHTLVINDNGDLRFQNITSTMAGKRHYISLCKQPLQLPREQWIVYALGLFFFEVATRKCIFLTLKNARGNTRIAETADCNEKGALFTGIIGKATANKPDNRYHDVALFLEDVNNWCTLETAMDKNGLGKPQIDRLRHLWNMQLSLERRTHLAVKKQRSFLEVAPNLAMYIMKELDEGGYLKDNWLKAKFNKIVINQNSAKLQLTSLQIFPITDALQNQWSDLLQEVKLQRTFTACDWLICAMAANEIESVVRALRISLIDRYYSLFDDFCIIIADSKAKGNRLNIGFNKNSVLENELQKTLEDYIIRTSERILEWRTESSFVVQWPTDLFVNAVFLLVLSEGIIFHEKNADEKQIGPIFDFRSIEAYELILKLLDFYTHDIKKFKLSPNKYDLIKQAANLSQSCVTLLHKLRLIDRYFAILPESAFQKLYTDQLAQLDLSTVLEIPGQIITASRTSLLPYPSLSPFHCEGCPFSVDLIKIKDNNYKIVSVSLPPVVLKNQEGKIFPILVKEPSFKKVRQGWNLIIGKHILYIVPFLGIYLLQVYLRSTGLIDSSWFAPLDSYIPNLISTFLFYPYIRSILKRIKSNEELNNSDQL